MRFRLLALWPKRPQPNSTESLKSHPAVCGFPGVVSMSQRTCRLGGEERSRSESGQPAELLLAGEADIGLATEALADYAELVALPSYQWSHRVIVPKQHALADEAERGVPLTLERLAQFPIITYEPGFTGRSRIDEA